jgi:hypothetical protein
MAAKKPIPENEDEVFTLRLHLVRETKTYEYGGVDVIVSRKMLRYLDPASRPPESTLGNELAEASERWHYIEWQESPCPWVKVEATNLTTAVENDHVYHCRYDETNGKWYFRAAKKGKPNK